MLLLLLLLMPLPLLPRRRKPNRHTHTHKKKSDKGWKEDVLLGPVKDRIVVGRSGKHRRERMRRQGSACTG